MRAAVPIRFYRLSLLVALCCLAVVLLQPSWSQASGPRDYQPFPGRGESKQDTSQHGHYGIPLCQIHGLTQRTEQAAEEQDLHLDLGSALRAALKDQNGDRVKIPDLSQDAIAKSFSGRWGSFDILVVEGEIRPVGEKKVMKAKLTIRPVSPPPGHPAQQMVFDEKGPLGGKITPCIMGKTGDEQARCRVQIVDEIKDVIFIHEKDCHSGKACSPQN